jgi:hypothetical protein
MLDLSAIKQRNSVRLPKGFRTLFLMLALIPICYGAFLMLDFMAFYKNSLRTSAIVVNMEPTRVEMPVRVAEGVKAGDYGPNELFFIPGFFYTHENGASYIGGALSDSSRWSYKPGEIVEIRYRREMPEQAQPITMSTFWAAPIGFLAGGLLMFAALCCAYIWAEIKSVRNKPVLIRRDQRLNISRR